MPGRCTSRRTQLLVWVACAGALSLSAGVPQSGSPPPDSTRRESLRAPDPALADPLRLRAQPERLAAGEPVTVLGADFGEHPSGRKLLLQLQAGESRLLTVDTAPLPWYLGAAKVPFASLPAGDQDLVFTLRADDGALRGTVVSNSTPVVIE